MTEGELFKGRYKILRTIGQGGMGKVYLGENIKLGSLWAIKQISKAAFSCEDLPVEPNIMKKLNHPSLPRIFDIVEDNDDLYIIEDYIEGVSLDRKLKAEGRIPEDTVIQWAKQICEVLMYLHNFKPNPIIYRDMKPSNIILTEEGDIKLIDFGIAREYKRGSEGDTVYIGTRGYAAPEQYGIGQSNAATDIYSLGITLYEMITGKGPKQLTHKKDVGNYEDEVISEEMQIILTKCTKMNSSERYQSVEDILNDIKRLEHKRQHAGENSSDSEAIMNYNTLSRRCTSFKKLVLSIWGNAEFGCELAYAAAEMTNYNVMLVDLDLLAPKADIYLNIRKTSERVTNEGITNETGLNIAMSLIEKNILTTDTLRAASIKRKGIKNLSVLTGNYRMENYEYYKDESLVKLIEKCYQSFDITILLVNKFIYDSYTVISLIKSDYNLVPLKAHVAEIREFNGYIRFLAENQHIPMNKTKFLAFEYTPAGSLSEKVLDEITSHNYLGRVEHSERRIKYRNLTIPYVRRMEKEVRENYRKLLSQFYILPRVSLMERVRQRIGYRF